MLSAVSKVLKMIRGAFLLVLALVAVSASPLDPVDLPGYPLYGLKTQDVEQFIVGGSTATAGQFPYQAALRTPAGMFFCGGVIVSNVSDCVKVRIVKDSFMSFHSDG